MKVTLNKIGETTHYPLSYNEMINKPGIYTNDADDNYIVVVDSDTALYFDQNGTELETLSHTLWKENFFREEKGVQITLSV